MKKLYLASSSASRQQLLQEMGLSFTVLTQTADESACDWSLSLEQVVTSIAEHKMEQVIMPVGVSGDTAFVITADTLTQDLNGVVYGKPIDHADVVKQLSALRPESVVATAFCVHKKQFVDGKWQVVDARTQVVTARCVFNIPDEWIAQYSAHMPVLQCAGSMAIEGYGMQFVQAIHGSYSGIQGLPVFELRQVLQELGFFQNNS